MLVVMVIGITVIGCMFKSYRMLGMLKEASSYAQKQQEEKQRFQQFTQAQQQQARPQSSAPRQTASATFSSTRMKMDPHPFGPRLEIKRIANPFGQRIDLRRQPVPLSSRQAKPAPAQTQTADDTSVPPLPLPEPGSQIPSDSALVQPIKTWTNYVSTIEGLAK
jgi:hypothetical protein